MKLRRTRSIRLSKQPKTPPPTPLAGPTLTMPPPMASAIPALLAPENRISFMEDETMSATKRKSGEGMDIVIDSSKKRRIEDDSIMEIVPETGNKIVFKFKNSVDYTFEMKCLLMIFRCKI